MMDTGNEVWKLGGRENKQRSGRSLEENAAGGRMSLSKFLYFFPPRSLSPFCFQCSPIPLQKLSVCVNVVPYIPLFMFVCVVSRSWY